MLWMLYNIILLYCYRVIAKIGIRDFNPSFWSLQSGPWCAWDTPFLRSCRKTSERYKNSEFEDDSLQCNMPRQLGKIKRVGAEVESRTAAGLVMKLRMLHGESGLVSNSQRHSSHLQVAGQCVRWLCLCRSFWRLQMICSSGMTICWTAMSPGTIAVNLWQPQQMRQAIAP